MRTFSAQYIFTNAGPPLKRGLIFTDEDGTIRSVKDTGGNLEEKESVEFYNGIIVPGFVNCHCHLELSHLKGTYSPGHRIVRIYQTYQVIQRIANRGIGLRCICI